MPFTARSHRHRPLAVAFAAALTLAGALGVARATPAAASTSQVSMFEAGNPLLYDTVNTLSALRLLGVSDIRLQMTWKNIAPDPTSRTMPKGFQATNPAAYPAQNWAPFDTIIRDAAQDGIGINLDATGRAPLWAMARSASATGQGSLYPSPSDYQAWVEAVAKRYGGTYTPSGSSSPLPAVSFWSVWNEPDYVAQILPQTIGGRAAIPNSPHIYRDLVDAAWRGIHAAGHGHDKMILGELTPRGYPHTQYGGMFPIVFVQSLYCVDSHYHALRGNIASQEGCPTTASASRRFRSQHPALFDAYGFSLHPYSRWYAPNSEQYFTCKTGLCASLADVGNLANALDRTQRAYGANKRFPIFSTEYGYQTSPPKPRYDKKDNAYNVTTTTAAEYINWAEYISYKNSRIASYDQYLLYDPVKPTAANDYGYSSGLITWDGNPKPGFGAFRMPLYLPKTSASSGQSLEVWGGARAAAYALRDTGGAPQTVQIQFEPSGGSTFTTLATVPTNAMGYFDTHVVFPSSGTVQASYTYPAADLRLAPGFTAVSRPVSVTVH